MDPILLVGLDDLEADEIRRRVARRVFAFSNLPEIRVDRGRLLVEHPHVFGAMVPVSGVVFHGIFEHDFDFLTALALWGGPCLPSARGLMEARLRVPCLVRALAVTRFGYTPRGFVLAGGTVHAGVESVAKWGQWHCGEDKARFVGSLRVDQATLIEDFVEGEAVRVVLVGERSWQIRMAGDGWLRSIHHPRARQMPVDPDLLDDTWKLAQAFGLELAGVDYIVAPDGSKHLLELNHAPNVTAFPEVRAAFLDLVAAWASGLAA